ncbi:MAG TPA: hypothetical protein VHP11_05445 [Tepidisphaeraceae bacterium]|nr:hypothetical protein [Tepidisphaeraceae bacterium]
MAVQKIRQAIAPFKKAALFELAEDGFQSVFQQLVACIISIRTRDETTVPTAKRLFAAASTPQQLSALPVARIEQLIRDCTFPEAKAPPDPRHRPANGRGLRRESALR